MMALAKIVAWLAAAMCCLSEATTTTTCLPSVNATVEHSRKLDERFRTDVVMNEFIVKFEAFYEERARRGYISAALAPLGLKADLDQGGYQVLERDNPMAAYPSDFDVLHLSEDVGEASRTLLRHPAIKSVTPQRKVTRTLKAVDDDGVEHDLDDEEEANVDTLCSGEDAGSDCGRITKGRRSLAFGGGGGGGFWNSVGRHTSRRLLRAVPRQITGVLQADFLWERGITGAGVKVAIFDTGLSKTHPHFKRVRERTNWTNEKTLEDGLGHGTFVAGVIASSAECLGFAPEAEVHVFRVFTNNQGEIIDCAK